MPTSYKIKVTGNLGAHVYSKDVFMYLCGRITADGATYIDGVSQEHGRRYECGVKGRFEQYGDWNGREMRTMCCYEKIREFLERYERSDEYAPPTPDPEADYASEIVIAADDIEPQIAAPHRVDNIAPVGKYAGMPRPGLYMIVHQQAD